jgi:hypothetical protein
MPRQKISRFALALALLHLSFCILALIFGDHTVWWAFDYVDWPASILFNALREIVKDSGPSLSYSVWAWIDGFLFLGLGSLWYFGIGWFLHRLYQLIRNGARNAHV